MTKMKCTAYKNGSKVASEEVDGNSKAAARNSAMMKLSSSDNIDWDSSEYTISCSKV